MEELHGGRDGDIRRHGEIVYRPAGSWTPAVQRLLAHVVAKGIDFVPQPLGITDDGREMVSYVAGTVINYPLDEDARSETALLSAARLLRRYHDATTDFSPWSGPWQLAAHEPFEVMCHGDFAPYNVALDGARAVGIIDFDTAHPGPRYRDICYALYRWAPFTDPSNHDGFGDLATQIRRARLFCDAYRLDATSRVGMAAHTADRLRELMAFMGEHAAAGDPYFQNAMRDGHHLLYETDIRYIQRNAEAIDHGIRPL